MGETFGHVVPGVFYCVFALILLFITRQNRDDSKAALTGTREMRSGFGWGCFVTATTGFVIEGVGGLLHSGDFFLQFAHETMYMSFMAAGAVGFLESRGRLPEDSWRLSLAMAFFVEGLVFYGHMLEQEEVERMLHFLMVVFSWFTAFSYFMACIYKRSLLPHVLGAAGMFTKGIWFFYIAHVLYSGVYGVEGKMLMIATGYTVAGVLIVLIFSLIGCCMFGKGAGAYDDLADDEITNGIHPPVQKNYSKVANVNDA